MFKLLEWIPHSRSMISTITNKTIIKKTSLWSSDKCGKQTPKYS